MFQVVDLEMDPQFQALDVALVSVTTDPVSQLELAAQKWKITTPLLSDEKREVVNAYGVMRWAHGEEPGHTFILIGREGKVVWVRDYGAPENGGKMYVPVDQLVPEIAKHVAHA